MNLYPMVYQISQGLVASCIYGIGTEVCAVIEVYTLYVLDSHYMLFISNPSQPENSSNPIN
jgi:hypothetical protein